MSHYDGHDPDEAFEAHLHAYFAGHKITRQCWPLGPVERRIPGFFVYAAGPGPRFPGWSYLTSGCWKATARHQHGLEFILSANAEDLRHAQVLAMLARYHAGPQSQRLDLGHTAPIGEPWTPGSPCEFVLIALPYAYGPEIPRQADLREVRHRTSEPLRRSACMIAARWAVAHRRPCDRAIRDIDVPWLFAGEQWRHIDVHELACRRTSMCHSPMLAASSAQ